MNLVTQQDEHPRGETLSAFHDGQLDAELAKTVAAHVTACAACTLELQRYSMMSEFVNATARLPLSQIGRARLNRQIDAVFASGMDSSLIRFGLRVSGIAASILLLGTIGLLVGGESRTTAQAAPPWVGVAVSSDADTVVRNASTPAAAIYLADASSTTDAN